MASKSWLPYEENIVADQGLIIRNVLTLNFKTKIHTLEHPPQSLLLYLNGGISRKDWVLGLRIKYFFPACFNEMCFVSIALIVIEILHYLISTRADHQQKSYQPMSGMEKA